MTQVRARRLAVRLLTAALVVASVGQINAEVIFFANGRTMSVKGYRVAGNTITVTLPNGGEATFDGSIVARIDADEVPEVPLLPAAPEAGTVAAKTAAAKRTPLEARPFAALIEAVSLEHGIDPALVHAVIQAESNYQPKAKSHVGARGLMQVMPSTARDLGVTSARQLFDPQENIEAGVKYLKFLLGRFDGDLTRAIAAYNAGPGAVSKYEGVPPFPETRNYVRKVLGNFQH